MIHQQFLYLKSCVNREGQLVDKKLKAPLDFQYHYSSFILSSILLKDYEFLDNVLKYYLSISSNKLKISNDFNVMLLLLAFLNDSDNRLDKYKASILNNINHHSNKDTFKLNNNFRALRLVGKVLELKVTNSEFNQDIDKEIDWLLNLQFDDGFFPDSNMKYKIEKNKGVSHLIYHTKIMMCMGMIYLYTQDERLKESFFRGLKALLEISSDNYYFFYGRSTNALFGYGSLYLTFVLAYKFSSDKTFINKADDILLFLKKYQHDDGHISINLNKNDNKRMGFDSYMYEIVYNAYSNTLFLLGDSWMKILPFEKYLFKLDESKVKVYSESGFIVYNDEEIKYCLNFKGHQNSLKHLFDSRVSAFSLLYFNNNDNLLPAIGYRPQSISSYVERSFLFKKLYERIYKYFYFDWLPILSGNGFFYIRDNIKFYPFRCIKKIRLKDKIILKFEARSRSLFFDKDIVDYFVLSINIQRRIVYKIFFYKKIDKFYYSYREIDNKKNFDYQFSCDYKKLRTIKIATSNNLLNLYRCKFKSLNKIEIKVSLNNEK